MGKTIDDYVRAIREAQATLNGLIAEAALNGIESRVGKVSFRGSLAGVSSSREEVKIILEMKP